MFKNFRVKNFRGYDCPRKFFNNEIFPDYGIKFENIAIVFSTKVITVI